MTNPIHQFMIDRGFKLTAYGYYELQIPLNDDRPYETQVIDKWQAKFWYQQSLRDRITAVESLSSAFESNLLEDLIEVSVARYKILIKESEKL